MNELVLHHTYAQGIAFDLSNSRYHGTPIKVTPGTGSLAKERDGLVKDAWTRDDLMERPGRADRIRDGGSGHCFDVAPADDGAASNDR